MSILSRLAIVCVGLVAASAGADWKPSVCGRAVANDTREVLAIVRTQDPSFVMTPAIEEAIRIVYPTLAKDSPNLLHDLILAGAPPAAAFTIDNALQVPGADDPLSAQERDVLSALAHHEGKRLRWNDPRLRDAAAYVLKRGRWSRPLGEKEFDLLGQRLIVGRTDIENATVLMSVLRRGQTFATTGETIGTETLVTEGQMLAIERHLLEALIAQGGVKMQWDRRLEGVAHYVIEQGRKHVLLHAEDFDYLTRALRNGGSKPQMVQALMRVLRGPKL